MLPSLSLAVGQSYYGCTFLNAEGKILMVSYAPSYLTDGLYYQSGFQEIMGFNEPDLAQQGTSTPEVAASAWTQLVDTARGTNPSVKLISPAVAFNQTWLSSFFDNICPGWSPTKWGQLGCQYAPDYVAVHMYTTDFDGFTSGVGSYHSTFGLPVVVSEFAAYSFDSSSGLDAAGTSAFMASTTQWLDSQDWVIKYAWFGAMRNPAFLYGVSQENQLMDTNGALTAL
ncbi:hypothetical protein TREMEDRAFT_32598 [Tremella mesenterica DSM 1558]|uniref:uncharacterized protein n=1 Tax=Tremella mesenterica (strain ATCC 24925 / CBS 8224 / DSM 1558 / NBRC 9311 / NRRL Y-6157 / RJB 2259-6 / UBC 559-6) TaxID=578456 RepID=UPI0003F4A4B2|nr:uncharacterized protein TREMEDRAFT_32598 [Tremella mesenterica DSM 1558]EIW67993.1 hypothetical protein TREMEDRAFT_32598 [Tremella mesenterica DSM 1558]